MYSLSIHHSDWNIADTDCSGHTTESGNTAADNITGKAEGSCAMECASSSAVTCSIGAAVEENDDDEEEGDEGGVTSGREEQLQL